MPIISRVPVRSGSNVKFRQIRKCRLNQHTKRIRHRFCRVKVSNSLQLHDGSGSTCDHMKSTEERFQGIDVDKKKDKTKDKVPYSKCVDVLVLGEKT